MRTTPPMIFVLLFSLIELYGQTANAQRGKIAKGEWNAKLYDYSFLRTGTAFIFVHKKIKNTKEELKIIDNENYLYYYRMGETKGKYRVNGDTLIFTYQRYDGDSTQKFRLYVLTKEILIYSNRMIAEQDTPVETSVFEPIEMPAAFKYGPDSLFKLIYQGLVKAKKASGKTVSLNQYTASIDSNGVLDPATLICKSGNPNYLSDLKKILTTIQTEFIPARQNGRNVKVKHQFEFSF